MEQLATAAGSLLPVQDAELHSAKRHGLILEGSRSPPLRDIHLASLLEEQNSRYPQKEAVISRWQGSSVTYESLYDSTRNIAHSLLTHGVRPKDRVVVLAGNTLEYTELFFAVGAIGAIFSIINPTFTADEVVKSVEFLEPVAVFIADAIGYRNNKVLLNTLRKNLDNQLFIVQMGSAEKCNENVTPWNEFLPGASSSANEPDLLEQYWGRGDPHDGLCIQFTSGTTGPRKAALVTHRNLINNALLVGSRLLFTPDDIVLCCSPIFHCFSLVCGVLAAIVYGGSVIFPSDVFMAESSIRALAEQKCTVVHAVPAMFQAMLDHPQASKYSPEFCLRTGIVAGSTLSRTMLSRLDTEFRFNGLAYALGMTECSCITFCTNPSEVSLLDDHISVGTVMPHTAAKVVDSELRDLPLGSNGELVLSGYLVFKEYYKNPEQTERTLIRDPDGRVWLRTGDLVNLSTAGTCIVIGRVKDMIKRGGENIFPSDIETALESDPEIEGAAVIGIPDPDWGEIVGVFIKSAPSVKSDFETRRKKIKLQLRKAIAPHKIPEHFFWIGEQEGVPEQIPRNETGKVLKNQLRDIAGRLLQRS